MKNYNAELDILFDKWDEESKINGLKKFCSDGLMLKGDFFQNENGDWGRLEGKENELWHNAEKRVLFLLKDTNNNSEQDMRTWIGRRNRSLITIKLFKNIALWLLGLNSFQKNGDYRKFEEAIIPSVYSKEFDELPISIVNIKKESGKGNITNNELWDYLNKYEFNRENLKKQVEILDPNIVVCGGGSGTVLQIAKQVIYPDLVFTRINDWVLFNDKKNLILIDAYHPTVRTVSFKDNYNGMMNAYQQYLLNK